jgi:hypothetical protein
MALGFQAASAYEAVGVDMKRATAIPARSVAALEPTFLFAKVILELLRIDEMLRVSIVGRFGRVPVHKFVEGY